MAVFVGALEAIDSDEEHASGSGSDDEDGDGKHLSNYLLFLSLFRLLCVRVRARVFMYVFCSVMMLGKRYLGHALVQVPICQPFLVLCCLNGLVVQNFGTESPFLTIYIYIYIGDGEGSGVTDLEDLGNIVAKSKVARANELNSKPNTREMITPRLRTALSKQGVCYTQKHTQDNNVVLILLLLTTNYHYHYCYHHCYYHYHRCQ